MTAQAICYVHDEDGNAQIERTKRELFRLAPDFQHAIEKDAAELAAMQERIAKLESALTQAADMLMSAQYYIDGGNKAMLDVENRARAILAEKE